jgi:formylglycine-generating enzyme required for sulfatase activity
VFAPESDSEDMVRIHGGTFLMGTNSKERNEGDGESPVREVELDPFLVDRHAVTNREFFQFVRKNGYTTDAEGYGWSYVFEGLLDEADTEHIVGEMPQTPWWKGVRGANWAHPTGPNSSITDKLDHPVVHVSWSDAVAYCRWAEKRLPTEAEWERAARGGLEQRRFPWGDELTPNGEHRCNIWQGTFPTNNTVEDGFEGTAPVDAFPPNDFGIYNVVGNVWEYCHDWFGPSSRKQDDRKNPTFSSDGAMKAIRGGSFLCHRSYCNRYRVAARTSTGLDDTSCHKGFRCVRDAKS